jgi:hypothetical protein
MINRSCSTIRLKNAIASSDRSNDCSIKRVCASDGLIPWVDVLRPQSEELNNDDGQSELYRSAQCQGAQYEAHLRWKLLEMAHTGFQRDERCQIDAYSNDPLLKVIGKESYCKDVQVSLFNPQTSLDTAFIAG